MNFEVGRIEILTIIDFFKSVIQVKDESKRNCLFVEVDGDNVTLTAGGNFVTKKHTFEIANTATKGKDTQHKFMIPRVALMAFETMVKEHKAFCTKKAKSEENYLIVKIGDKELESLGQCIEFDQPIFEFDDGIGKDFQNITEGAVSEIPMIPNDVAAAMAGLSKTEPFVQTFTGLMSPVHYKQGDYEVIITPPIEKKDDEPGEQTSTDGKD